MDATESNIESFTLHLSPTRQMELLERSTFLSDLDTRFQHVKEGTGHTVFLLGEAGIGKSSLLNAFLSSVRDESIQYIGACDSLFTPRPLGPLYDIADQLEETFSTLLNTEKERAKIFGSLYQQLHNSQKPVVVAFEDVHWADEATMDLIKFLARRINRIPCLFIVTYRDDEIHSRHPLTSIFGELPILHYTKLQLTRLSRDVVERLANETNWVTAQQLFELTSGNPFYVTEILSTNGIRAVPERVKDSILARFNTRSDGTKAFWEFLSIMPSSKIDAIVEKEIEREFGNCMDECIAMGIIISKPGHLSFNHELFRKTIEESLTPVKRKALHKKMLSLLEPLGYDSRHLAQLVHHARFADERELVARLAPKAAQAAEAVSAHREAAKLYSAAIDFTDAKGEELAKLYEKHAYASYITYQHPAAIASQQRALGIWRDLKQEVRIGDAMRFLSRLWWIVGDHKQAVSFGKQAIEQLEKISPPPQHELALAYSNASQIAMLAMDADVALELGNKAISMATLINDKETLSHALNNVGSSLFKYPDQEVEGEEKLLESLTIALDNKMHEHVARAYVNLSFNFLTTKKYSKSIEMATRGIHYCTEHDVDVLRYYMMATLATAYLESSQWKEAEEESDRLISISSNVLVKIVLNCVIAHLAMRKGEFDYAQELLDQIEEPAFQTNEMQRVSPVVTALLELNWLKGTSLSQDTINRFIDKIKSTRNNSGYYSEFAFWNATTGNQVPYTSDLSLCTPYKLELSGDIESAAREWAAIGCAYEQAITLVRGNEEQQRTGLKILDELGAVATSNRIREELKAKGVKNIPRGPRESTLSNPALLTERQLDILNLLKDGLPNKEIAEKLFISPKTVDHHISAILSKLNVNSRAKAVVEAQRLGILN